jgi:hypothetical protein
MNASILQQKRTDFEKKEAASEASLQHTHHKNAASSNPMQDFNAVMSNLRQPA